MFFNEKEQLEFDRIINKLVDEKYRDDFKQEMYLIILSLDVYKIEKLRRDDEFIPYFYGIINNQYRSRNSAFYKKYIKWNEKRKDIEDRYI